MKKYFITLMVMVLMAPIYTEAASKKVYELNVSHHLPAVHPIHLNLVERTKKIESLSNGKLKFIIYDNCTLSKPQAVWKAIRDGGVDIGLVNPNMLPADFPHAVIHDMSFLNSDALRSSLLMYEMCQMDEVKAEIDIGNGMLLYALSSDRWSLGSANFPIHAMDALKGKRVIVNQATDEIKSWGGNPVFVPIPEVYLALQRGMGDVFYGPTPMFAPMKLQEVVKYMTVIPSTMTAALFLMNKNAFSSLPEDLQKILLDNTGKEATYDVGRIIRDACLSDIKKLSQSGVQFHILKSNSEELKPWQEASDPVMLPYWKDILTRGGEKNPDKWIQKVRELASSVEEQAAE
ncbi:MAG: TRAP transporter substrate-binding protein DctP [Deltaproteobacteria bacterium]|nr:TRAP transporter substrate-binding protein DctP [Deltaproteobacteria bacterium]